MSLVACEHFKFFNKYTIIVQADYRPWNAWVKVFQGNRLIYKSYITGLFSSYLYHLKNSPECRKEIGVSLADVIEWIGEMEREWEAVVKSDC